MGRKLWGMSCTCLAIIAVFLGGSALLGLLGLLIERGGNWSGTFIFLALDIGLAIYNYKTAFPFRKRARTLFRLFEIVVVILGLLGLFASIFEIGSAWSWLVMLPLLINCPIANYLGRTQRTSYPNAQTHYAGLTWTVTKAMRRRSWKQADKGMRYVTVTLKIDNSSSSDFVTSWGDYLRLRAGDTTSAPTPHTTIPTLLPAGSSGQIGSASFLMPERPTFYTLLFLGNPALGVSEASVDFEIVAGKSGV